MSNLSAYGAQGMAARFIRILKNLLYFSEIYRSNCLTFQQRAIFKYSRSHSESFQCIRWATISNLEHFYVWRHSLVKRNLSPARFFPTNIPITQWSKHGHTALLVPGHDPPIAIKISMDVHPRPGPTTQEGKVSKGRFTRYDFVACDNGLRQAHDMIYDCFVRQKKCRSILKHVLKRCDNRKSCRRPVVSLSHATKSYRVNRP